MLLFNNFFCLSLFSLQTAAKFLPSKRTLPVT